MQVAQAVTADCSFKQIFIEWVYSEFQANLLVGDRYRG